MIDASGIRERLVRPEYTGENRCLPCTVLNVAIAAVVAAGIGLAGPAPAGVLAFGSFAAIITLRGYLIPGTPTLTRRYLPERVLVRFGKATEQRPTLEAAGLEAAADALAAAGVVTRDGDGDGLALTSGFRRRWRDRLDESRTDGDLTLPEPAAIAPLYDADEVSYRGEATVEIDGRRRVRWPSDAALAADIAADRELRRELDGRGWIALDPDDRRDVLTGLRLLRDRCPACDGRLATTVERNDHCCRRPRVAIEHDCEDCGRLIASLAVPVSEFESASEPNADSESGTLLEWLPDPGTESGSEVGR